MRVPISIQATSVCWLRVLDEGVRQELVAQKDTGTHFLLCNSIQDSSQFRYSTCIVVVLVHSLILCCGIGMPLPEESITVEATHTYKQRGSGCKQPHSLHHSKKLKHPLPCYSLLAGSDRNHRRLKDADGLFHYRSQLRHWQWTNTSEAM